MYSPRDAVGVEHQSPVTARRERERERASVIATHGANNRRLHGTTWSGGHDDAWDDGIACCCRLRLEMHEDYGFCGMISVEYSNVRYEE